MTTSEPCPRCGARQHALETLYDEVARLRETVERQGSEQATIDALTQEVRVLRETVARLRGTSQATAPRPVDVPHPAAVS